MSRGLGDVYKRQLLKSFKLSPKASKPGPKFALVAGIKIFKFSPKQLE